MVVPGAYAAKNAHSLRQKSLILDRVEVIKLRCNDSLDIPEIVLTGMVHPSLA